MKKVLLAVAACALLFAPMVYADPIGDVTASCGKAAFSVGYFYDNQKMEFKHDYFSTTTFTSNQVYLEGAYGIAKGWDAFLRFGGASAKTYIMDTYKIQDDFAPYGSIGFRGYVPVTKGLAVGAFAKFNYYGDWKDEIMPGLDLKVKDNYDFIGGLSAKIDIAKFTVYGGPFYYYARSKQDFVGYTFKMENNRDFGGLLGVKVPVAANLSVNAEGQYKDDRFSGGIFASYLF
jgi:hypothetical protein